MKILKIGKNLTNRTLPITPILLLAFSLLGITSCHFEQQNNSENDLGIPVLSPIESIGKIHLQEGFTIKLVASEPLISTPVAMTFDDRGRIWLVEMSDYHPIKEDSSKQYPLGKVVILEDKDGDGKMDTRKVFIDSLTMPRALCLVDSGLLVATPPDLWYIRIDHDKPGKKILVDSAYTVTNNPEGQTNGLLRGMDNWIYSAGFGSDKRYRRINGHWVTQKTFLRGQWGVTQDDYGHLFYNNNSQNLLGDYFLPGVTHGNKYQRRIAGFNQKIVADNRVYPLVPTPGVNRGYRKGVLDSSGKLVHFTAACGPLIYRGGVFPEAYEGNAFVCEPAAFLIKRNILTEKGTKMTGREAYKKKEFLASTDRRFRPVSLSNGPDGALYVVDMYRGVIQDALSITDYLKDYSLKNGLNKPANCGRIYKIIPKGITLHKTKIPDDPRKLVSLLASDNGWIRENAQQKIVDNQYKQLIPAIRSLNFNQKSAVITKIHALWILEGLSAIQKSDLIHFLKSKNIHLRIQALDVLIAVLNKNNYETYLSVIKKILADNKDTTLAPYLTYTINKLFTLSPENAEYLWGEILKKYPDNVYVADAIISTIQGKGEQFKNKYKGYSLFHKSLNKVLKNREKVKKSNNMTALKKEYPKGYAIFKGTCQTCHGADGNGIEFVAPPLNGSNWVKGNKGSLIPIILYGLSGPVKIGDKVYKKPEVLGEMPGFGNNKFSDSALAEVISFIRQAWNNDAGEVTEKDIKMIRKRYKGREQSFTMKELMQKHKN